MSTGENAESQQRKRASGEQRASMARSQPFRRAAPDLLIRLGEVNPHVH